MMEGLVVGQDRTTAMSMNLSILIKYVFYMSSSPKIFSFQLKSWI